MNNMQWTIEMARGLRTIHLRTVIAERPANVPIGWLIYNAARPLDGDMVWQGDFCHGVFYSALDPNQEAGDFIRRHNFNASSDAYLMRYMTEEEVFQRGKALYLSQRKNIVDAKLLDAPKYREWLCQHYLDHVNHDEGLAGPEIVLTEEQLSTARVLSVFITDMLAYKAERPEDPPITEAMLYKVMSQHGLVDQSAFDAILDGLVMAEQIERKDGILTLKRKEASDVSGQRS